MSEKQRFAFRSRHRKTFMTSAQTAGTLDAPNNASIAAEPVTLPPLQGTALAMLTVATALATFMEVLDTTIANVAVPTISGSMGVSANEGTSIISSYSLAAAIAVPLTGWLSRRVGEVRLLILSVLLFTLFSVLCGFATNYNMLVFFRLMQGLVSGPMVPLGQSIMMNSYPPHKRGMAMAFWAMTVVIAPVVGPVMGGYITENFTWPWIFYINVPIGVFCAYSISTLLKGRDTAISSDPIDVIGLVFLVLGVGSLQYMLEHANDLGWFQSKEVVTLTVMAVVGLTFLAIWEWYDKHPVVDLRLIKNRNFTVGTILQTVGFTVFFGNMVVMPLWLQTVLGYDSFHSGLAVAPVAMFSIFFSPVIGMNMHKVDLRWLVLTGFGLFAFGAWYSSLLSPQSTIGEIMWGRFLFGLGIPFFFIPLSGIVMQGMEGEELTAAAGFSNFLRTLGGAIGTAVFVTVWSRRTTFHHARLTEDMYPGKPMYDQFMGQLANSGMTAEARYNTLNGMISGQAASMATLDILYLSAGLFVVMMFCVFFAKPVKGAVASGGH
ncbi:Multidrug export protein EmrB [Ephemeroptericola cinctiostellae]|uniref:Multidrug export protein EmrB n=2 Tax=Ephemeroptericola cinctiostellae TaxID=2268024 RepID=A0A345D8K1_9BURK|nr:Multidrug export protein EmrB [Ephemeroptericola cinctiostellae]